MSNDKETTILVGEDTVAMARAKWAGAIASHVQPMPLVNIVDDEPDRGLVITQTYSGSATYTLANFHAKQKKPNAGFQLGSYRFKSKKQ